MGRGKLKYRDVVGGGRKGGHKQNKPVKKKQQKPRKTYSLYEKTSRKQNNKRKFNTKFNENDDSKKQKVEKPPEIPESSSESDEEMEDHMRQLRNAFSSKANDKKLLAIDSSDDSLDEERESESDEASENELNEEVEDNKEEAAQTESENEEEIETSANNDDEETDNDQDPFVKHLFYDLHEKLLETLQATPIPLVTTVKTWPKLGRLIVQTPKYEDVLPQQTAEFSIAEVKKYAQAGQIPTRIDCKSAKPENLCIKSQIVPNLSKSNPAATSELFTALQSELFAIMNNYQDLYFAERTFANAEEIRFVYCLHAVNHILKTRMKVIHHNGRLAKKDDVPKEFRDQGLVRPKILFVVPFRASAYRIIQMLISILIPENKGNVMNKKRFLDEFTGNEIVMPKKNPKPEDYEQTFSGNTGDDFRIGLTITKKSIKLFADFYSSDIIVASPLGLRTIIGAEGEAERDFDFLASIELLIFDQMELFLMQNWDHFIHLMSHLHLQPKDSHGTDFGRVRTWSLNGWAKYYRQTLIFSSLILPEINSIFNKKCFNYAGKVKISNQIEFGSIAQVVVQIPHVFHKFDCENVQQSIDARFDCFISKILPQQKDVLMKQTLIFIANYFDYVRLRNYFKREEISFVQICEYSKEGKIARARDMFFHGDAHFLLYTERHHFFNRIRIKGIRHLVFYQLPTFPHFYYELCNLMQDGFMNPKIGNTNNMTVSVLYSRYDVQQLAAVVGTDKAAKMMQSDRNVHMMITGSD